MNSKQCVHFILVNPRSISSWKPIVENIESRFDSYLEQENRVNRQKIVDNRVHACLYFIQPTGHSLVPSQCSIGHLLNLYPYQFETN